MTRLLGVCAAAVFALAGCAYDYGYGPYAAGYGPVAYYDGYYGPYWDGYWGREGAFWYAPGPGRPFHRDVAGHFRRGAAVGFRAVAGHRAFRRRA